MPASTNAVEVIQTSQLHACTFQLLFTFILQGSASGLCVSLLVCEVKICYLTTTCVSPSPSNPAVDCATESWLYMSEIIGGCRWANAQRQGGQSRLASDKLHCLEAAQVSGKHLCCLCFGNWDRQLCWAGLQAVQCVCSTVSYTHTIRTFQVLKASMGTAPVTHQDSGANGRQAKHLYHARQLELHAQAVRTY